LGLRQDQGQDEKERKTFHGWGFEKGIWIETPRRPAWYPACRASNGQPQVPYLSTNYRHGLIDRLKSLFTKPEIPAPPAPAQESPVLEPPTTEEPPGTLEQAGHKVLETGGEILHKAGDLAVSAGEKILEGGMKIEQGIEAIGETVLSAGEKVAEKAGDLAGKVGHEVIEKGGDILEKAKEFLQETGHKVGEEFGKLYDKAQDEAAAEEADKQAREEQARADAARYPNASSPLGKDHLEALQDSSLAGKQGFFDKLDRFAKGDYGQTDPQVVSPAPEAEQKPAGGTVSGFEDQDGDGDALIDDAEIVDDKKPD